jgi:hypothetical protein
MIHWLAIFWPHILFVLLIVAMFAVAIFAPTSWGDGEDPYGGTGSR